MTDSEHIAAFLDFLREATKRHDMAVADEALTDAQTQDILHQIELEDNSYRETARLGKLLKQVRVKRRAAKDNRDRLTRIAEWACDNSAIVKSLERLLGDVRKVEQKQKNRIYVPRTDILEAQKTNIGQNEK